MNLTIESKNSFLVQNPEEFIVECRKNKPAWVAEASRSDNATAAVCPSFVMLFKHSYLIKCPAQIDIAFIKEANRIKITTNEEQMELESHDLVAQMGPVFSDFVSMKIGIKCYLHTDEPCMPLMINTFAYTPQNDQKLRAMEGILPLNNKVKQKLNINTVISKQQLQEQLDNGNGVYSIRPGTPLALLYFPAGLPKLILQDFDPKVPTVTQSRHMKGSYLARMKDWFGV
ncbi:MAG: hypothetical protein HKN57_07260 [Xanthomonadales bacterium]|nr:hypothetical protein [Gammaproteobacteria bacterium]NND57033.1 hypothetical protein [Xanthomonadales bacterium]